MLHDMPISVIDLASRIGGSVDGDGTLLLERIASIARARPGDITFARSAKDCAAAEASAASAIIVPEDASASARPLIRVRHPKAAFARALAVFHPPQSYPSAVHPTAQIGAGVTLGRDVFIGAHVVVGDRAAIGDRTVIEAGCFVGETSALGADCLLHAHVTVYHGVTIGHRVIIHAGAVIGSDGFHYVPEDGRHLKIPQVGDVIIEDEVEIGANTTIDRGTIDSTVIGRGTKIDNLVQIAHDVTIGEGSIVIAQVGIAGGCRIGRHVVVGGQAGIGDHRDIGDHAVVGGQSFVTRDLAPGSVSSGTPAQPLRQYQRQVVALKRLSGASRAAMSAGSSRTR